MSRLLSRFTLLFLAFWILGGQWLALQSVAWVNMVRDYSQQSTLSKALLKTFDGNHPCRLCRFIQKEKASEEGLSKTTVLSPLKVELLPVVFAVLTTVFLLFGRFHFHLARQPDWGGLPLTPPPKPVFL